MVLCLVTAAIPFTISYSIEAPRSNIKRQLNIPRCARKKSSAARVGCQHWQPEHHPEQEGNPAEKKEILKTIDSTNELIYQYLEDTYPLQRLDINNGLTIGELIKEWPKLFEKEILKWHFQKLTGNKICLGELMIKKASTFLEKFPDIQYDVSLGEAYRILKCITTYFKEDLNVFIKAISVSS